MPGDDDVPFVLHFHVFAESFNVDEQELQVMMSTRRLVRMASKSDLVQVDATYKITWQGYPLIVIGTTDKSHTFHPFGVALCKGETAADFAFVFRSLQKFNTDWNPTVLLADGADAITGGYVDVFGAPRIRLMCFYHVLHNLEKYLKPLAADRAAVLEDIHVLQTSQDPSTFLKASQLFVEKWRSKQPSITAYFEDEWLQQKSEWYEGAGIGYPSTNNGIEGTNAWIKREQTLRERLPVGQFLNTLVYLLEKWSTNRDPQRVNHVPFAEEPTLSLKLWTTAYQWALSNKEVLVRTLNKNCIQYFTASSKMKKPIDKKSLQKYLKIQGKWSSFDEFKKYNYGVWKVTINANNLRESTCTCPYFLKHEECKHSLGMKIREKLIEPPSEARTVPLGCKRKRGRPSKAKRALLTQ